MRSVPLLLLGVLAACATSHPAPDWVQVQRQRLERAVQPRDPELALARLRVGTPDRGTQDPRKIDQIEPAAPGTGLRPFRSATTTFTAAAGLGTVAARYDGTGLDDRTDLRWLRLGVDAEHGVGLHVEAWTSDADLFPGQRINDGRAPADAEASADGIDFFPHLRLDHGDGVFRLPLRVGAFTDWQQVDHERARVERDWIGAGGRIVVEPTWRLAGQRDRELSLVGRLGADLGVAWFAEEFRGGDDRDTAMRWSGEAGLALRGSLGAMHAEVGYGLRQTRFGAVDAELFGDRRSRLEREQLFVGFGLTW